ncbi:MAG: hypothetical protein ACTSRC_11060 [Candidatus Helarchaeota archaeon]
MDYFTEDLRKIVEEGINGCLDLKSEFLNLYLNLGIIQRRLPVYFYVVVF